MKKTKTLKFEIENKTIELTFEYEGFEDSHKIFKDSDAEYVIRQFRKDFFLKRKIQSTECMSPIISFKSEKNLSVHVDKVLTLII